MDGHCGTRLDPATIEALLRDEFPQAFDAERAHVVEAVGPLTAQLRLRVAQRHLRPGGTVSGPAIFTLADLALYVAVLAQIGPATGAVTTSITLNFLRKPPPVDLVATCRLLKLGRRLAVGEVSVLSVGGAEPVAHATGTYSIPPSKPDTVS